MSGHPSFSSAKDPDGAPDRKTFDEPQASQEVSSPTSTPSLPPSSQRDPKSSRHLTDMVVKKRKSEEEDEEEGEKEKEEAQEEEEESDSSSSLVDLCDRISNHLLCARGYSSSTDSKLSEKVPRVALSLHKILFSCLESASFIEEALGDSSLRKATLKAMIRDYKRLAKDCE